MNYKNKGFTLVEILIVVIILGILAAIVIPQFTSASDDARASAVVSDLQSLRSQIELYKIQHHDNGPDVGTDGNSSADGDDFVDRLTGTTDEWGDTTKTGFGPYLQSMPSNPFADAAVRDVVGIAAANPGTAAAGWWYNPTENKIYATHDVDL